MNEAQPSDLLTGLVASLDLNDYEDVATAEVTLVNPKTLAPTTSKIQLASKEHPARKQIDMSRTRRLRAAFTATGKMPTTDPIEEIGEETDYLVAATLGWSLTVGGADLAFSPAAARALYTDPKRQWVRAQVLAALNKSELFIESSSKP